MDREAEMTEWNGDRLDEFRERVDDGFAKVDKRFEQVDKSLGLIHQRLDALQQTLIRIAWTFGIGMLGLSAALIGVIATQL